MVLAVLQRRARLDVGPREVFCATVGGMRLAEPAADLAVALAVTGSLADVTVPSSTVVLGEVGLAGEVRGVPGLQLRLAEAARLGVRTALVPPDPVRAPGGIRVVEVPDVAAAMSALYT
jgi:DNA repair protein RadA/Sms